MNFLTRSRTQSHPILIIFSAILFAMGLVIVGLIVFSTFEIAPNGQVTIHENILTLTLILGLFLIGVAIALFILDAQGLNRDAPTPNMPIGQTSSWQALSVENSNAQQPLLGFVPAGLSAPSISYSANPKILTKDFSQKYAFLSETQRNVLYFVTDQVRRGYVTEAQLKRRLLDGFNFCNHSEAFYRLLELYFLNFLDFEYIQFSSLPDRGELRISLSQNYLVYLASNPSKLPPPMYYTAFSL